MRWFDCLSRETDGRAERAVVTHGVAHRTDRSVVVGATISSMLTADEW